MGSRGGIDDRDNGIKAQLSSHFVISEECLRDQYGVCKSVVSIKSDRIGLFDALNYQESELVRRALCGKCNRCSSRKFLLQRRELLRRQCRLRQIRFLLPLSASHAVCQNMVQQGGLASSQKAVNTVFGTRSSAISAMIIVLISNYTTALDLRPAAGDAQIFDVNAGVGGGLEPPHP